MFKATPVTDRICSTLQERCSRLNNQGRITNDHIMRLANLLILVAPTEEEALQLSSTMPNENLMYGQFRLDCEKLEWVILI